MITDECIQSIPAYVCMIGYATKWGLFSDLVAFKAYNLRYVPLIFIPMSQRSARTVSL